jgi:hypothetical protein
MAPIAPVGDRSIPREDDSGTIPSRPRDALIVAMRNAIGDPTVVGDLALAGDVAALLAYVLGRSEATDGQ